MFAQLTRLQIIEKVAVPVLFGLCLLILYRDAIAPVFGYMGFSYHGINWWMVAFQSVLIGCLALVMPSRVETVSHLFHLMVFKFVYIPSIILAGVVSTLSEYQVLGMNLLWTCALLILISVSSLRYSIAMPCLSPSGFWVFSVALIALFAASIINDFGVGFSRLFSLQTFAEIYDIRYSYRSASADASFISTYGLLWLAKVLVPLSLMFGLIRGSWLLVLLSIGFQLFLFSVSAHKSFLFSILFTLFVFYLLKFRQSGLVFQRCLVLFVALSALLFYVFDISLVVDVVVRRVFAVPGMLTGFYLEFFGANPFAFFGSSIVEGFSRLYHQPTAFVIGYEYFDRVETSANVNFLADAYAHAGYIGVILFSLFMGILLAVADALALNKEKLLVLSLYAVPFWTLTETSLLTTLLSHGFILALLLTMLLYRKNQEGC